MSDPDAFSPSRDLKPIIDQIKSGPVPPDTLYFVVPTGLPPDSLLARTVKALKEFEPGGSVKVVHQRRLPRLR